MATDAEINNIKKDFLLELFEISDGRKTVDDLIFRLKVQLAKEDYAYVQKVQEEKKSGAKR